MTTAPTCAACRARLLGWDTDKAVDDALFPPEQHPMPRPAPPPRRPAPPPAPRTPPPRRTP